ncbi:MAG: alginate export family protein [Acidobacteria bacterium]|nr:alginate export family protein [Acidobacteriota bacterium]
MGAGKSWRVGPSKGWAALLILVMIASAQCRAQGQPDSAKSTSSGIRFSGSVRIRSEAWGWFNASPADPNYAFFASLLRLSLRQDRNKWDWQVEVAQPLLANLPENAIAPAPQGQLGMGASYYAANLSTTPLNLFLKQGFVRTKGLFGDGPSTLRVGRFEFIDGAETSPKDSTLAALKRDRIAHRLIGNFGFTHVGRSFDGAQYVRGTARTNITLLAARATSGVFQVNGWRELDTDIFYGALTRSAGKKQLGEWRVFAFSYHDGRNLLKADNRPQAVRAADHENIRITSVGGHYLQTLDAGSWKLDGLLWGAGQSGHWGILDHRARAFAAEAGLQPKVKLKPWFRCGYFYSTGDGNPADGTHETFFQVLPTPRIYARFPFYNLMNNQDAFVQLILRPHPKWTIRSDAHTLRLTDWHDLWYSGGGAFQQTTFGYTGRPSGGSQSLANIYDVSVDYQLNAHLTLTGYYAGATGRTVIEKIYPTGAGGQFGYGELNWKF